MRVPRIVAGVLAMVLLVGVVVLELSALTLATRSARAAFERCARVDEVEVVSVARPAVVALAHGEVRDVRVSMSGIWAGDLWIAEVDARMPTFPVRWGSGRQTTIVVADARVTEGALTDYLAAVAPEFARPTLTVTPGGLEVGDERVPFTLELLAAVSDGDLTLVPTAGDPRLWSSLGLELELDMPEPLELLALDLRRGELMLTVRGEFEAGVDREAACPDMAGHRAAGRWP